MGSVSMAAHDRWTFDGAVRRWGVVVTAFVRVLVTVIVVTIGAPVAHAQAPVAFETADLAIETGTGARHGFVVELALSPAQQQRGLMFRDHLPIDRGMLFIFPDVAPRSFWMKNTFIPLDILFIGPDGRIVHIHRQATPRSTESIPSRVPARAVLELAGGATDMLGIAPGDRVIFPVPTEEPGG